MSTKLHAFMTGYLSKQADSKTTDSENASFKPEAWKTLTSAFGPSLARHAGIQLYAEKSGLLGDGYVDVNTLRQTTYNPLKAAYEALFNRQAPNLNPTSNHASAAYLDPDGWAMRMLRTYGGDEAVPPTGVIVPRKPNVFDRMLTEAQKSKDVKNVPAGVLAHELGHASRGRMVGRLNFLGKPALMAGAFGAATMNDEDAAKKATVAGTAGGLITALTEIDASRQGSKILRHAKANAPDPKLLKGNPYVGVPTYLLSALLPLATFYTKKSLGGYRPKPADPQQA